MRSSSTSDLEIWAHRLEAVGPFQFEGMLSKLQGPKGMAQKVWQQGWWGAAETVKY